MDSSPLLALLLGAGLVLAGALLGLVAVWMRRGRSRAARWWVRKQPLREASDHANAESIALVITPLLAQTLVVAGLASPVVPWAADGHRGVQVLLLVALVGEMLVWGVLLALTAYRWVLPPWLYPRWLRPQRLTDAAEMRRPGRSATGRPTHRASRR